MDPFPRNSEKKSESWISIKSKFSQLTKSQVNVIRLFEYSVYGKNCLMKKARLKLWFGFNKDRNVFKSIENTSLDVS